MKSENPLLKEKEITRDYYLKRMLIWQQISSSFSTLVVLVVSIIATFFIGLVALEWEPPQKGKDSDFLKILCLFLITFFGPVTCFFAFSTYYSRQYWKAHKECQELANPTFTSEQQHVTH